jgi:hypothetical protein
MVFVKDQLGAFFPREAFVMPWDNREKHEGGPLILLRFATWLFFFVLAPPDDAWPVLGQRHFASIQLDAIDRGGAVHDLDLKSRSPLHPICGPVWHIGLASVFHVPHRWLLTRRSPRNGRPRRLKKTRVRPSAARKSKGQEGKRAKVKKKPWNAGTR